MSPEPIDLLREGLEGRLGQQIGFVAEIGHLRTVMRTALVDGGRTRENDAEHSWHVALMAATLCEYADRPVDSSRVIRMLLVHDLVEIDAGDVMIYDEAGRQDQVARKLAAAERIFNVLPSDQAAEFRALWDEFEALQTAESVFARAIDCLQPMLLNYLGGGAAWREHGITADQVRRINRPIADGAPRLWDLARELIDDAVRRGWLPD